MNKNDLRNFMIVRDGLDMLFLVIMNDETHKGLVTRNYTEDEQNDMTEEELNETLPLYELDEFDNNFVHIEKPVWSIVEVYDCLPIEPPFNLDVEELFNKYQTKLLWKRDASPLSLSKLKSFGTEEEQKNYIESIVPPYIVVA